MSEGGGDEIEGGGEIIRYPLGRGSQVKRLSGFGALVPGENFALSLPGISLLYLRISLVRQLEGVSIIGLLTKPQERNPTEQEEKQ